MAPETRATTEPMAPDVFDCTEATVAADPRDAWQLRSTLAGFLDRNEVEPEVRTRALQAAGEATALLLDSDSTEDMTLQVDIDADSVDVVVFQRGEPQLFTGVPGTNLGLTVLGHLVDELRFADQPEGGLQVYFSCRLQHA